MSKNTLLTKSRKIAIFGLSVCIFGLIYLNVILPSMIKSQVAKKIVLKNGLSMRNTWKKSPFSHELHTYIFNVTNPDEISKGEKPILKEFGPYIYDVWPEKVKVLDNEEDDTLSYKVKNTYFFNAAKSNGLSDEDEFTLPHFLMLSACNSVLRTRPTLLPLASKSLDFVYNIPKSVFVKVNIKTYMFDGYVLDCTEVEDFFGKVICNDIKEFQFNYRMIEVKKDFYTTSLFGSFNDTIVWSGENRIRRGIKNMTEVGEVVGFNNVNNFAKWNDSKCDEFAGTDGTIFHPFLNKKDILYAVHTFLCRSFAYQYDSTVKHAGMKLLRYTTTVGTDLETNPEDKCYCLAPDRCPKNGVYEVWKCMTWALLASNPHFYLADPYYTTTVVGVDPKKAKHVPSLDIDPLTGITVRANFRYQLVTPLTKQPKFRLFKNFPVAFLPIGWFEEKIELPKSFIKKIKKIHTIIRAERIFGYILIIFGFLIVGLTVGYEIKESEIYMKKFASKVKKRNQNNNVNEMTAQITGNVQRVINGTESNGNTK